MQKADIFGVPINLYNPGNAEPWCQKWFYPRLWSNHEAEYTYIYLYILTIINYIIYI